MKPSLRALETVDFQWTTHVDSVWRHLPFHVPELQAEARTQILRALDELSASTRPESPLGLPLLGPAGAGKTHLLNTLRKESLRRDAFFVLIDMTDVNDFHETLLLGTLRSLSQDNLRGRPQLQTLLEFLLQEFGDSALRNGGLSGLASSRPPALINACNRLIHEIRRRHREGGEHQDVIRALLLMGSNDFDIVDLGDAWLQGVGIGPEDAERHGFRRAEQAPERIVRGLSWVMALAQPTVLALDQLDAIVAEHNLASSVNEGEEPGQRQNLSLAVIQGLAGGLLALRDYCRRTQIVVSCLEATWEILNTRSPVAMQDRYEPPILLRPLTDANVLKDLVRMRLDAAYGAVGFVPPYTCYPYRDEFFAQQRGASPRELLKRCEAHRRECRRRGEVFETGEATAVGAPPSLEPLRARFEELKREAPIRTLLEREDDEALDHLLETACLVLSNDEYPATSAVDAAVDLDFPGRAAYPALHARIRLIYHDEGDRERHYSFRFLQHAQHRAFQARLKAAITCSGIDAGLPFRRLAVLRVGAPPAGAVSQQLLAELQAKGGVLITPEEADLATLWAIAKLQDDPVYSAELPTWLVTERIVSQLSCLRDAVEWLFSNPARPLVTRQPPRGSNAPQANGASHAARPGPASTSEQEAGSDTTTIPRRPAGSGGGLRNAAPANDVRVAQPRTDGEQDVTPPSGARGGFDALLPIGERLVVNSRQDTIHLPLQNLRKHGVILAGAGSGKTVLLKRLIEEAVLLGVPAIVIDGANDLSLLGDAWSDTPEGFRSDDAEKARDYHSRADVVIWTPGIQRGNPLCLDPIPDLAAVADDADELAAALQMVVSSLSPIVAKGAKAQVALGVLMSALQFFTRLGGGSLRQLISLLRDLPPEACEGFEKGERLAREMSERLLAQAKVNPLLGETGTALDPRTLLGEPDAPRTRVSVINLSGLRSQDARQQFLDQLSMTLFSYIKKNPARGRPLLGLLVIDEARDFVPSGKSVPGKENMIQLVAQARKYGLGILFATQSPRGIDNKIIANCATQFYGRSSSPAAIETVQEQLRQRGGSGHDIARLERGVFYVHSEGMQAPARIATRLCLSAHPPSPPDEGEILQRALRKPVLARAAGD